MKTIQYIEEYPVTNKQKLILDYLYRFRFLDTHQIQRLLGHKNPNRTLSWLKDLIEKDYVRRSFTRKSFIDSVKPALYFLGPKARKILLKEKDVSADELEYIYLEHRRKDTFIKHCQLVANLYLYLLSQKEASDEIRLFTKIDLKGYDYFPDPMPDAFVAIKSSDDTRRYFVDIFDDYTPSFILRKRVQMYLEYLEMPNWPENTNDLPFPKILFILPNQSSKTHVFKYGKAVLEKSFDDKLELFLTTRNKITLEGGKQEIWEKVE